MTVLPELSFQEISQYFHLPISQAAKELKVCETLLKKICRVNGIKRWPHRKIRSIDTMINLLEFRLQSEKLSEKEKNRMRNEIVDLIEKKSFFMNSPNTTYQSIIPKNTLQSFSKTKLKNQKSFSQFLNEEAKKPNSHLLTQHNSLFSTLNHEENSSGISMIVTNLRSKTRRNKQKINDDQDDKYEYDDQMKIIDEDDDSDYIDPDFSVNLSNTPSKKSSKKNSKKEISIKEINNKNNKNEEKNNNENLEEEEEEVLNVLYSLSKEKQKSDQLSDQILNNNINNNNNNVIVDNNNDQKSDQVDDNNNNGTNELYKLSLLAILNPMQDEGNINNNININNENNRVNELKKRNFLRRSSENFDQNLSSDVKRRKFDYEFSSDPNNSKNNNNFTSSNQLIKL